MSISPPPRTSRVPSKARWLIFLGVLGPGLVVMLADTDVGSVITAAQSGAQWGYKLLALQLLLIPVLYVVQELTVRLGVFTGKGHGELIRETFGAGWAWISVLGLAVATIGALLTEFSGIAGVGELFGVPRTTSLSLAVVFLLAVVWTGTYRRVERIAIALGLFELVFVWVALRSPVDGGTMLRGLTTVPWHNSEYWYLVAANIGAVIMPWMEIATGSVSLRPLGYGNWSRVDPGHHGVGIDRGCRHPGSRPQSRPAEYRRTDCRCADAGPWTRAGPHPVRPGHTGRRHGRSHRRLAGRRLGFWRGDRVQTFPGTPPAG